MPSVEIFKVAEADLSVSSATVKRAKRRLEPSVEACRESQGNRGGGRWMWRLARGSRPSDVLANPKSDALARSVVTQGVSAFAGSQGVQGSRDTGSEPLAGSRLPNAGLFEGLAE